MTIGTWFASSTDVVIDKGVKRPKGKGNDPDTIIGGFVRTTPNAKTGISVEVTRPDELSQAANEHPRPWTLLPRSRKTKLAIMGISKDILVAGDPRYAQALYLASKYRKVRARELSLMHGHVSSGASALLASASLALAASRFLYEKVAETGDIALLKQAAQLADSARQSELAAWEMSAREGIVHRKLNAAKEQSPWLVQGDPSQTRQKPGRKTNEERHHRELMAAPEVSKREMTIDDVLGASLKEKEDGMEGNRGSAVQVVQGVPGPATEPNVGTGVVHGTVLADSGAEAGTGQEGRDAGQADGNSPADQPSGSQCDVYWLTRKS